MPVLTSKLVATLVDQISGPAKAASASIVGMGKSIRSVNAIRGTAQGPQAAALAMRQFSRDSQQAFAKAEASAHRFAHEMQHGIGIAALASGAVIGEALRAGIETGAEFAHQQALFRSVGMTGAEVANATAEAWRTTGEVAGSTIAGNLQAVRELRGVFGDTREATERLVEVQRAAQMMRTINPAANAEDEVFSLAKALELKGVSQDPVHFAKLLNEMVKSSNAFGGKVGGKDFLEFMQYARAAGPHLSDEFLTQIAPTLMQELGASQTGTALSTMRAKILGNKLSNKSAAAWIQLGLLNPKDVKKLNTGEVKFSEHAMKGADLFQANPYEWVQKVLKPALDKQGITDPSKISEILARGFGDRTAEQFASILLMQSQRIEKDAGMQRRADGSEGYDKTRFDSPIVGFEAFRTSFGTLLASLTSPLMKPAAMAMYYITDGINMLAGAIGRVPGLGAALGGIGGIIAATTALRTVGRLGSMVGMTGGKGGLVKTLGLDLVGRGVLALASPFTALTRHAVGQFQTMGLRYRMMTAEMRAGTIGLGGVARGTFATIGRAVVGLVNPLALARGALTAFKVALAGTGIGLAILAIGAGFEFLRNNAEGVEIAFEAFKGAFMRAIGPLQEGSALKTTIELIQQIWTTLTQPIDPMGGQWADWGIQAGKFAGGLAKDLGSGIDYVKQKWEDLKQSIDELLHRKFNVPWFLGGGTFSLTDAAKAVVAPMPGFAAPGGGTQLTPSPGDVMQGVGSGMDWLREKLSPTESPRPTVDTPGYADMMNKARELGWLKAQSSSHDPTSVTHARVGALQAQLDQMTAGLPAKAQEDMRAFVVVLSHGGDEAVGKAHDIADRLRRELTVAPPSPFPAGISPPIGGQPYSAPSPAAPATLSAYHAGDVHATFNIQGAADHESLARTIHGKLQGLQQASARGLFGDYGITVGA